MNPVINMRPLRGCVSDLEITKQYLESGQIPVCLSAFTSSAPSTSGSQSPQEDMAIWPTSVNLDAAFDNIYTNAKPEDLVYIHFSGHGTTMPPRSGASKPRSHEELALVVFTEALKVTYIPGSRFAKMLEKLVEKNLQLTVVLDCCFSGGIIRKGNDDNISIRTVPYDPIFDPEITDVEDDTHSSNGPLL
jgi:hypothetical protein